MNKPILYVMMGLPASGKSSYAKQLKDTLMSNTVIISSDSTRKEWYGSESIQGNPNKLFEEMRKRTVDNLCYGRNVIYDATNLTLESRSFLRNYKPLIDIRDTIAVIGCLCITPFKICCERNSRRERIVPMEVMDRMLKFFTPPMYSEGFDKIRCCIEYNPSSYDLSWDIGHNFDMPHDNPHHLETIGEHTRRCEQKLIDLGYENIHLLGYYHDLGKYHCKTFAENGIAHYYNHECVSAYIAMCDMLKKNYDFSDALYISTLVRWHMLLYCGDFSNKMKELLGEEMMSHLRLFNEVDKTCRRV